MYAPGPALRQHPTATDLTTAEAPSAPAPRNTPRSSTRSSAPTERSTRAHNAEHAHANPSNRIPRQGARTHPGTPDPTWPDHPESHHPRYQPAQQKEWSHINPRTTDGRYHEPTRERSSPVVLGRPARRQAGGAVDRVDHRHRADRVGRIGEHGLAARDRAGERVQLIRVGRPTGQAFHAAARLRAYRDPVAVLRRQRIAHTHLAIPA